MNQVGAKRMYDCTSTCYSAVHSSLVVRAVTHGTDKQVIAFLERLCANYEHLVDEFGRSILHMAASCNRWKLLTWLLDNKKMDVDGRDRESGWTPLHRAIFYGHVSAAKVLIEHGASLSVLDDEFLAPLDVVVKDRPARVQCGGCKMVYVWGSNDNYNLGLKNLEGRELPELLEAFGRNQRLDISQVLMHKFHTVFLTSCGTVLTCGHGYGGRLGLGSDAATVIPQRVKALASEVCISVVVGINHTVFLTKSGSVWTCGLNTSQQLGHCNPVPSKLLVPKRIEMSNWENHEIPVCICAGNYHTVVMTRKVVFTFGQNLGQLGFPKEQGEFQAIPKLVTLPRSCVELKTAAANDAATACLSEDGQLFLLHDYRCRRIASGLQNVMQLQVHGGRLDTKVSSDFDVKRTHNTELCVAILTREGEVQLWTEQNARVVACLLSLRRPIRIAQFVLNEAGILFVTNDGEGFSGTIKPPKVKSTTVVANSRNVKRSKRGPVEIHGEFFEPYSRHPWIDTDSCFSMEIRRLPLVHRASQITSDFRGLNFAVIQKRTSGTIPESVSESRMRRDMETLLNEASVDDVIHDVVIRVGSRDVAAHAYVLASCCPRLVLGGSVDGLASKKKRIRRLDWSKARSSAEDTLRLIYTGSVPVGCFADEVSDGSGRHKSCNDVFHERNDDLGIDLLKHRCRDSKTGIVPLRFELRQFPELSDVVIVAAGGQQFSCHRCILVARSEFFDVMFSRRWHKVTKLPVTVRIPFPASVLEVVLHFLYSDDSERLHSSGDVEFLGSVLAVADCWLLPRLLQLCESALARLVTFQNAVVLFEFALEHHADRLKTACCNFFALNLAVALESGFLEDLSEEALEELSVYYRRIVGRSGYRVITPDSTFEASKWFADDDRSSENRGSSVESEPASKTKPQKQRTESVTNRRRRRKRTVSDEQVGQCRNRTVSDASDDGQQQQRDRVRTESCSTVVSDTLIEEFKENKVVELVSENQKNVVVEPKDESNLIVSKENMNEAFPVLSVSKVSNRQARKPDQNRTISKSPLRLTDFQDNRNGEKDARIPAPVPITLSMFLKNSSKTSKRGNKSLTEVEPEQPSNDNKVEKPLTKLNPWNLESTRGESKSLKDIQQEEKSRGKISLSVIQREEKLKRINLEKITSKPLNLIQIEEKAMNELLHYYEKLYGDDELITVQRVQCKLLANPEWKCNK